MALARVAARRAVDRDLNMDHDARPPMAVGHHECDRAGAAAPPLADHATSWPSNGTRWRRSTTSAPRRGLCVRRSIWNTNTSTGGRPRPPRCTRLVRALSGANVLARTYTRWTSLGCDHCGLLGRTSAAEIQGSHPIHWSLFAWIGPAIHRTSKAEHRPASMTAQRDLALAALVDPWSESAARQRTKVCVEGLDRHIVDGPRPATLHPDHLWLQRDPR